MMEFGNHVTFDDSSAAGRELHQGSAYTPYVCIKSFSLRILTLCFLCNDLDLVQNCWFSLVLRGVEMCTWCF